jgi:hypothetical protein
MAFHLGLGVIFPPRTDEDVGSTDGRCFHGEKFFVFAHKFFGFHASLTTCTAFAIVFPHQLFQLTFTIYRHFFLVGSVY